MLSSSGETWIEKMKMGHCTALAFAVSFAVAVPASAADVTPSIEFHDGKVTPLRLEVPANTRFKIIVHNTGKTASEFESHRLHKEKVVAAGHTISVEVHPLAPGKYDFFDDFHEGAPRGVVVAK
jgi:hypothetical protein